MKVTLTKAHKHAGRHRRAGDEIDVTVAEAEWLAARGKIAKRKSTTNQEK